MMMRCIRCKKRFSANNGESPFLCPEHRVIVRDEIRREMKKTMRFRVLHRDEARERARRNAERTFRGLTSQPTNEVDE